MHVPMPRHSCCVRGTYARVGSCQTGDFTTSAPQILRRRRQREFRDMIKRKVMMGQMQRLLHQVSPRLAASRSGLAMDYVVCEAMRSSTLVKSSWGMGQPRRGRRRRMTRSS